MIALFRHGITELNLKNRLQGWIDEPLADVGENQVRSTAKHYLKTYHDCEKESILVSSDLRRSIDSANIFDRIINVGTLFSSEFMRERNWGELDGLMNYDNRVRSYLKIQDFDHFNMKPANGESIADLYERVSRFLDTNRVRYDDPNYIRIFHVHSNVMRVLIGIFTKTPPEVWLNLNASHTNYYIIDRIQFTEVQP